MEEALKALDVLTKSDITELKALAAPPKLVKYVMDAVCVLVNKKYEMLLFLESNDLMGPLSLRTDQDRPFLYTTTKQHHKIV